jgi:thiol-disulfide isomerase/thioredoxin
MMNRRVLVSLILALAPVAVAQSLTGLWDATVVVNGLEVPFKFELADDGGSFFNGDEKVTSTSGHFENGTLVLNFDHYGTKLQATLKDGVLEGQYGREGRQYPFRAKPFVEEPIRRIQAPSIDGMWQIQVQSPKGESAWKLIVRQKGVFVSAAILRIDGDTGTLTGRYKDGKFVLSHFSGARPSLLEVTLQDDGTLDIVQIGKNKYVAYRPEVARAKGLAEPTDPSQHTHMGNAAEPLRFSFADLNGKIVSNTDARFQGKVLLVNVMGSWCPNCHDETPFLVELYRKYHAQGLEIVALSFEEQEQLASLTRLRSFIQHYGIEYTVLVPGTPDDLHQKLPQPLNLNSWPTTFFIGRDGKVHAIHAGFPGAATGALHQQAKEEITSLVEGLLGVSAVK